MTDQKIIKEMARLEGFNRVNDSSMGTVYFRGDAHHCDQNAFSLESLPDYLDSHDACQRVIDGMSEHHSLHLAYHLRKMLTWSTAQYYTSDIQIGLVLKATPRQKCEAILKAYDKWEEENNSNEVR